MEIPLLRVQLAIHDSRRIGQQMEHIKLSPTWQHRGVRLADQAVVALVGMGMINRAAPRACGHSRGSRRLDTEPETRRTARLASNETGNGFGRAQDDQAGFQPYWGKPAVRNDKRGWRKRGQDLMAICHELERADTLEAIGLNRSRLRSTRPVELLIAMNSSAPFRSQPEIL
jgi:hypothetical protein